MSGVKTIEQVKTEQKYGEVLTLDEFIKDLDSGCITPYDGVGYFHDGESETKNSVWDDTLVWDDVKNYPYVCWYNK